MRFDRDKAVVFKYIFVWSITALLVFASFIPGRKSLVIVGDGFNQCYPALAYLGKWYKALLRGKFQMYDFSIGFGEDVIGALSWYGIGDILILPFSLVPFEWLELSYTLSIVFRLFLAGLLFLKVFDSSVPDYAKIMGALLYSFCPFVFQYSFIFLIFATPLVWLPVIVAGLKDGYNNHGKFSIKLYLGLLFLAMSGFYFLYMVIIAIFVFIVIRTLFNAIYNNRCYGRSFFAFEGLGNSLIITLKVGINVSLAIMSSGVFLIPVIMLFLQSPRVNSLKPSITDMIGFCKYNYGFGRNALLATCQQLDYNGETLDLFCISTVPFISAICYFFLIHHIKKLKKYELLCISSVAVLALFSNGIILIMNAFSYVYFRYQFLIFFVVAYLTTIIVPDFSKLWDRLDTVMAVSVLLMNLFSIVVTVNNNNALLFAMTYLALLAFMVFILLTRKPLTLVSLISCAIIALWGFMFNAPFEIGGQGFCGYPYYMTWPQNEILSSQLYQLVKTTDDNNSFARYDVRGKALNASLLLGVPTTYSYYSICNRSMLDFYSQFGVSSAIQGTFIYQGLDERQVLESIFCTKYYNNGNEEDVATENMYQLPLGISYDRVIKQEDVSSVDPIEKQQLLLDYVIVAGDPSMDNTDYSELLSGNEIYYALDEDILHGEIPCEIRYSDDIDISDNVLNVHENSNIEISFKGSETLAETYLILSGVSSDNKYDIEVDDKVLRIMPENEESYLLNNNRYVNISDIASEGKVTLSFNSEGAICFGGAKIITIDYDSYREKYNKLKNAALQNTLVELNEIKGETSYDTEKCMLFSIPYSSGWKAYIDGNEMDVVKADYGLIAVFIPEGRHDLILRYTTPGLKIGLMLSVVGIILAFLAANKEWFKEGSKQ